MGELSREVWRLLEAKRRYWTKTLSQFSLDLSFDIFLNIFDFFSFWIDFTLSDTLLSSLINVLLNDIPLLDITAWNLSWRVELPTFEQLMRGTLIVLEKVDVVETIKEWLKVPTEELEEIRDKLSTTEGTIETLFTQVVAKRINETRLLKGIYGRTRYSSSYYDPTAVRDFLRSTLHSWFQKRGTYEDVKLRLSKIAETLNIKIEVIEDLYLRLTAFDSIKEQALTWDYGWWDRTFWGPEETSSQTVPLLKVVDWSGKEVSLEYRSLFDIQGGGWWDESFWDYFYWVPQEIEKEDVYQVWDGFSDTYLSILRDSLVVNARTRVLISHEAIANYQTPEERRYPWLSGRTERYALSHSQRQRIENLVRGIVLRREPEADSFRIRLYISAALEIYSVLYGYHSWGTEMYKSMTEEEMKRFWIDRWTSEGLDHGVLEEIWNTIKGIIDRYGEIRIKDRLRFLRWRLAR